MALRRGGGRSRSGAGGAVLRYVLSDRGPVQLGPRQAAHRVFEPDGLSDAGPVPGGGHSAVRRPRDGGRPGAGAGGDAGLYPGRGGRERRLRNGAAHRGHRRPIDGHLLRGRPGRDHPAGGPERRGAALFHGGGGREPPAPPLFSGPRQRPLPVRPVRGGGGAAAAGGFSGGADRRPAGRKGRVDVPLRRGGRPLHLRGGGGGGAAAAL